MANVKAVKKTAVELQLPECPVCLETMVAPIYLCQSGHSICATCSRALCPALCPICRGTMTQMRNLHLEELVSKVKVPCQNRTAGCVYQLTPKDAADHAKECLFREIECPVAVVFSRCSWTGKIKDMYAHFKDRHPTNCNVHPDSEVSLPVSKTLDDRRIYLVEQGKQIFMLTVRINTTQQMVYWTIQLFGSKSDAGQFIYEIHVTSLTDARRKTLFIEYCSNDVLKADDIFASGKCAAMTIGSAMNFTKGNKMAFRFFIKRHSGSKKNDGVSAAVEEKADLGPKPKGPGPGSSKKNMSS